MTWWHRYLRTACGPSLSTRSCLVFAALRDYRCKHGVAEIAERLAGDIRMWGSTTLVGPYPVPPNHVFVTGSASEHISESVQHTNEFMQPPADSRLYGPCPSTAVTARIVLRIWPVTRFGYLLRRNM